MELILQKQNPQSGPTLCLNMIVKNESRVIARLLESVYPILDCYCICDTGSTDDTISIIETFFQSKNIPGKIVHEPFKNFSHNRNFALQACKGMSDYVILLDADMVLDILSFKKEVHLPLANSFSILQGNDNFFYQNMRIVRNNGEFSYTGVTHEYINTPGGNTVYCFTKKDMFIRDIGDGGAKGDKFERDIRLFLEDLKEHPNCERSYFYLANSYHDCGRFAEAINVYKQRIQKGGWREEVWYSYYRIGLCYKNMGKFKNALHYWLEGYHYYSERLEALFEIIHHYRCNSHYKLAMMIYKEAVSVLNQNLPREGYLFLQNDVYVWKLYNELTLLAAYNGISNIDFEAVKVFNHGHGADIDCLLRNMKFYENSWQAQHTYILDNTKELAINGELTKMVSSSSCLLPHPDKEKKGYILNVRYVNYHIHESGAYLNCDRFIVTANRLLELDENFVIRKSTWLSVDFDGRRYIGVEDVKIFYDEYKGQLLYMGTGLHKNGMLGLVGGVYGGCGIEEGKEGTLEVKEFKQDFKHTECEKNWVFVDYAEETHIVYEWSPLRIGKLSATEDPMTNKLQITEEKQMPGIFQRVRGSTCGYSFFKKIDADTPLPSEGKMQIEVVEKEIWFVTHIVSYENPRHYYHLICVFDGNMNLQRYSAPFKFEKDAIEYCLGIVVEEERVIVSYSGWDRTTRLAVYTKEYVESLLKFRPENS